MDLLGEITGGAGYAQLIAHSEVDSLFGVAVRFLDLETLIRVKHAAGRPKDFEAIAELEAAAEEGEQQH